MQIRIAPSYVPKSPANDKSTRIWLPGGNSTRGIAVSFGFKVAMNHPTAVTTCNMDLEQLITDQNRSIATLAITTLLKTGAETSVDRLMKQISSFVSEISDEFKIVVIDAIRSLCMRYPRKHEVMMNFLSTMLRDEVSYHPQPSCAQGSCGRRLFREASNTRKL